MIVGAGMDSFALRRPAFANDVAVFEVDHPASQALKLERLDECGVRPPAGVDYVAADLGVEGLGAALGSCPFDPTCGVPDSELVFSQIDQRDFDAPEDDDRRNAREVVAAVGEPWVSGFSPSQLDDDLRSAGLTLIEDLGREELRERYCEGREDGLSASAVDHVARARVTA